MGRTFQKVQLILPEPELLQEVAEAAENDAVPRENSTQGSKGDKGRGAESTTDDTDFADVLLPPSASVPSKPVVTVLRGLAAVPPPADLNHEVTKALRRAFLNDVFFVSRCLCGFLV
jgi:hypothetical protein